jgi:hypothetical protein
VSEWNEGSKRRSGAWGGGRETNDVGASTSGCELEVREAEGLIGGVYG